VDLRAVGKRETVIDFASPVAVVWEAITEGWEVAGGGTLSVCLMSWLRGDNTGQDPTFVMEKGATKGREGVEC
jgi:hypothetical protein